MSEHNAELYIETSGSELHPVQIVTKRALVLPDQPGRKIYLVTDEDATHLKRAGYVEREVAVVVAEPRGMVAEWR